VPEGYVDLYNAVIGDTCEPDYAIRIIIAAMENIPFDISIHSLIELASLKSKRPYQDVDSRKIIWTRASQCDTTEIATRGFGSGLEAWSRRPFRASFA